MSNRPKKNTTGIEAMVHQLITYHFPKRITSIEPLSGGITNHVYGIKTGKDQLVVRVSEQREKINFFLKEQWAVTKAKGMGIPTPDILEVGNDIIPLPYMIVKRIEGQEATHHPKRLEIIREMGRYATIIHKIPTQGYGHMFDWSQNTLSKNNTWLDYLVCELKTEERVSILKRHKMMPPASLQKLKKELTRIEKWKDRPSLHHGDLRLKNLMVNDDGKIVSIIDWENCVSSIGHYWDTSIALHDLSVDAQYQYLQGYQISTKKLLDIAPAIKVFNILNYAPVIEMMAREKQKAGLEHCRARLHGALDMYSL